MSNKNTSFHKTAKPIHCGDRIIDFSQPKVMGILNLAPDSFFDGGKYNLENQQIRQVEKMLSEGADIIDVGAVSTRPGANEISSEEELDRLLKPLKRLVKLFPEVIFSVDTYRSEVARQCVESGAHIINDISGGNFDDNMFETAAKLGVPYILMHIHGRPENMQANPLAENAVKYVADFFREKVRELNKAGVHDIILDPGFGFGKSLECNYSLLQHLEEMRIDDLPLLAGISRKSMINKVLGIKPSEALNGTTVLHTLALLNGANILRVHDVKEAMEAVKLVEFYKTNQEPGNKSQEARC
ncbi:MAG: dihydropteroate synthase [Chlorobi bacterium]|nr:dihydropteroate synthase [Chlorobiota bacterium]